MSRFPVIAIIYNPQSTSGSARQRAERLNHTLQKAGIKATTLIATEYGGHAETIAYDITKRHQTPLLISVSGDGGYNEVINGALRAQAEDEMCRPTCAIVAAGNANDHRRAVKKHSISQAILHDEPELMDVLQLTTDVAGQHFTRYAHSYIGFGVTGGVANDLNTLNNHNLFREFILVLTHMLRRFKPVRIISQDGDTVEYDNLICSKLHQMSKIFKIGSETDLHDGNFRLISYPHRHRLRFMAHLLLAAARGFKNSEVMSRLRFIMAETTWAHCDGEVFKISGGARVIVSCEREKLLTLR